MDDPNKMIPIVRDCFQTILDLENQLEQTKIELALRRDFTLGGAFNVFASSMQHRISIDEFLFGLDRIDIQLRQGEIDLFYNRYDSDQDGRLGFLEFSNALLPLEVRMRDELESR